MHARAWGARRGAALALISALVIGGCTAVPPSSAGGSPDPARAAQQARTFHSMANDDDWANYAAQFTQFCLTKFGFDCNRDDRDINSDLTSGEEVAQWDAEKNNPQSVIADINLLFIPQAREAGVLADYEPPNAGLLPDDMHGPGWVATFVGVPNIVVNVDALEAAGAPVPRSWADLTDPAYEGMIGMSRVGVSASATFAFVAMNLAAGGALDDWQPGVAYARRLLPNLTQSPSFEEFASGEIPIALRFDFAVADWSAGLEQQGVRYLNIIPSDGSVYAPQALMMNRYDTAHHDFAKMFMEWLVSDEGQHLFGPSGARPIRAVQDDNPLVVPEEYRLNWLPDADYERVDWVDWQRIDPRELQEMWENQVLAGG
jgi:putative spermidine/putrescine transport system substrate-binding protein